MQQRTLDILDKVLYGLIIALFVVIPFSEAGINIFAGLILIVLVATFVITRSVRGLDRGIWQPILALLIAGLLSLFFAADKGRGLHKFLSPLVKYVTVFVAVALTARTDSRRRWLTAIMLVTGLISAGYGIYQYGWLSIRRVYSFSYNPNVVAGYFAVLTALSVGLLTGVKSRLWQFVFSCTTLLGLGATVVTFSRGAIIGLVASGFVLFTMLMSKAKNKKAVLVVSLIICVVLVALTPDMLFQRFRQIADLENSSNRQRILLWQTAWDMFLDSPIVGQGPGGFSAQYEKFRLPGAGDFVSAHSVFLQVLAELGLLGFGACLWLGVLICRVIYAQLSTSDQDLEFGISLGTLLAAVTVLIHGLVDTAFLGTLVGTSMCCLAGLAYSIGLSIYADPRL